MITHIGNQLKRIISVAKTKVVTITAFVFIIAFSLLRATYFPEGDIFWGARNGIETLQNGIHIFQPDTWNVQTLGEEWSPNSWLWNVLLGGFYYVFGNYGFLLISVITNVAAYCFLWGYLQKLRMAPLVALLTLVLSLTVMAIFMNGRSNTVDFLILMVFLYLCRHYLHKRATLLIITFSLTVLWMNLHMTGVAAVIVFPAVVYAMLYKENIRRRLLQTSFALLSTLIALPLTPYGFEGLLKVSLVKNESKGLITEWSNVFSLPDGNEGILMLLGISIVMLFFVIKSKEFLYGALMATLIYGTYDTIRLTPFLLAVVLGAFVLWEDKTVTLSQIHPRMTRLEELTGTLSVLVLAATLVLSVFSVISLTQVLADEESMFYINKEELTLIPKDARAAVTQDAGSAIILYRPDVLVTLDGRNDLLGMERFVKASNILYSDDSEEVNAWLKKYDINTVFIQDSGTVSGEQIKKNMTALGWVEKKNDTTAVAYVRK